MSDERIGNAQSTPEGAAELAEKATGEAPVEEPKPIVLATARILCADEAGVYIIEVFSGLRFSYDLRRYRELAEAKPAVDFMVKMFSGQIIDAMHISGVPMKRLLDRKADGR
jgi:hypothetical protein